jgi:hypothetical protein
LSSIDIDDIWALALSNVRCMGGHQRRPDDHVSRAIHAISDTMRREASQSSTSSAPLQTLPQVQALPQPSIARPSQLIPIPVQRGRSWKGSVTTRSVRVHRSPPLCPLHRLALARSPQYAATPLRNILQPDPYHLPLPPPRPLSHLPRAYLSHRHHLVMLSMMVCFSAMRGSLPW